MKNNTNAEIRAVARNAKGPALFVLFVAILMANGQSTSYKNMTIAARAMTNATLSTLMSVESLRSPASQKELAPGLLAFSNYLDDIGMAGSFFSEPLRVLHADEMLCGEMWFGRALACKAGNQKVVVATAVTQPMSVIYRYWLDRISKDFIIFKLISTQHGGKDVIEFVKEAERAYNDTSDDESIPSRLRTGYCNEVPSGTYLHIDGQEKGCDSRAE